MIFRLIWAAKSYLTKKDFTKNKLYKILSTQSWSAKMILNSYVPVIWSDIYGSPGIGKTYLIRNSLMKSNKWKQTVWINCFSIISKAKIEPYS